MTKFDFSKAAQNLRSAYILPATVSVSALTATFFVSNADYSFETKFAVFGLISAAYMAISLIHYLRQNRFEKLATQDIFDGEIEEKLAALEDAGKFFGASLKSGDMFRLVAGRINEIVPFSTCVLYLTEENSAQFKTAQSFGLDAENFRDSRFGTDCGLAGKTLRENAVQTDDVLASEKELFPPEVLRNLRSAVAVALKSDGKIYGVLTLYSDRENAFKMRQIKLLEAVGARVSPIFAGSFAFEQNLEKALTDLTTSLPNERAFYMVLENRIAEAQRFREQRPLTVLAIDIKNFDEINQKFGHAVGDRVLEFAAQKIKSQLRRMDFLARSRGDEFFVILPTATDEITEFIIDRIENSFEKNPFVADAGEKEFINLSFGTATFPHDGETAHELLASAFLRKKQAKSPRISNVLWFPTEYAN